MELTSLDTLAGLSLPVEVAERPRLPSTLDLVTFVAHLVTGKPFVKEYPLEDSVVIFRSLSRTEYLHIKESVEEEFLDYKVSRASVVYSPSCTTVPLELYKDFEGLYVRLLEMADKGLRGDPTVEAVLRAIEVGVLDPHSVECSPRWTLAVKLALSRVGRPDVTRDASSLSEDERLEIVNKYNKVKMKP